MKVLGDIDIRGGGKIINMAAEAVDTDPVLEASEEGRIIYNTTENAYKYNNGSTWLAFEVSLSGSDTLISTLGDNWINNDLSFNPAPFNALDNVSGLDSNDSLFSVIEQLDTAITSALNVVTLQGVSLDFTAGDLSANNIIYFDGTNFVPGTVNDLDTVELNLSEIQDVNITTPADNEQLVYQSGAWVNLPTHFQYQDLSGTNSTFVVNHNLGVQFCDVTIIDMSVATPQRIDPTLVQTVAYQDANQLTVVLAPAAGNKPVTILVQGMATV